MDKQLINDYVSDMNKTGYTQNYQEWLENRLKDEIEKNRQMSDCLDYWRDIIDQLDILIDEITENIEDSCYISILINKFYDKKLEFKEK